MEKPIGELLRQWKIYLTNISRNLMELSEQTEVKVIKLKAKDTANGYTGLTRMKAVQCVESLDKLWKYYSVLSEAIEKAGQLYYKSSLLHDPEDDVRKILNSEAIIIEVEHVAINDRKLSGGKNNEIRLTPQQLLKHMEEAFEELCKATSEISQATYSVQSRLSNMKVEIERLNSSVRRLGIENIPEFDIDKITKLEKDPLQGALELDKLVYSIEKYRASIKTLEEEYSSISETLKCIKEDLTELKELSEKSKQVIAESNKVFSDKYTAGATIGSEVIESLEDWLMVLEIKLSEGLLKAVKVGASKLQQECSLKLAIEKENYNANSKDYNEWQDLKGEFEALLVKAEVLRAKGFLYEKSLVVLIEEIGKALFAKSVDLYVCRSLVKDFKQSLRS
jgi:prefoldin subunit 5